jgi:hypothetical protein
MLEEAYVKAAMMKAQVYEWHKTFRNGRASVNCFALQATADFDE